MDFRHVANVMQVHPRQAILLSAFMEASVAEINRRFRANIDVIATRIAIDTLEHFHFRVRPLPVYIVLENTPYQQRSKELNRHAESQDELIGWQTEIGAYRAAIGNTSKDPTAWSGHVVAIVNDRIMIDLALPMYSLPAWKIMLSPLLSLMPEGFATAADHGMRHPIQMDDGSRAWYEPLPSNMDFRRLPVWQRTNLYAPTIQKIKDAMPAKRVVEKMLLTK